MKQIIFKVLMATSAPFSNLNQNDFSTATINAMIRNVEYLVLFIGFVGALVVIYWALTSGALDDVKSFLRKINAI